MAVTVSVVIATLDRPDSLARVLNCLAQQTRPALEILIAAAGDLPRLDPRLPARLIPSPDKSAARQRNLAAAQARGEVLAFLDDDIEFGPDLFAALLAHFDRSGESD